MRETGLSLEFERRRFRGPAWLCLAMLVSWGFAGPAAAQSGTKEHPLLPAIRLARESQRRLEQVRDYEATFTKREQVNNRLISQRMFLRLRVEPFSVYMKFQEPSPGREILYVDGWNRDQLLVREARGLTSLIGTISLAKNSPQVMAENRHPITNVGMHRLIEITLDQWELEANLEGVEVKYYPNAKVGNAECEVVESSHPRPRRPIRFHMTRLFLERETRLPIRIENYDFPVRPGERPPLLEEYTYSNVRANIGLTDADFDRNNPNYSF